MADIRQYSTYFSCLHDEPKPIGSLGRGTHYSVFRSVEWLDVQRRPLALPHIHDFAVIWDEDHDVRVIEAIEHLYLAGLLSPVQFIGERKGMLTVIVASCFYWSIEDERNAYKAAVEAIAESLDDPWTVDLGSFDKRSSSSQSHIYEGIIADGDRKVGLYLGNIDSLWSLGTRPYQPFGRPWTPPIPTPGVGSGGMSSFPPMATPTAPFPPGGYLPPITN